MIEDDGRVDFSNQGDTDSVTSYVEIPDEEEYDEESISWNVLVLRIFCVVLFFCIVASVVLGAAENEKVYLLAIILGVVLIIVFMCSFVRNQALTSVYEFRDTMTQVLIPEGSMTSAHNTL